MLLNAAPAAAQRVYRDSFEGPEPSWHDLGGDANHHILVHDRIRTGSYEGEWCEHLRLQAAYGTYAHLGQNVPAALVIEELVPSVWVKADRPGIRLLAHVVLPRSIDPKTGQPLTMLVSGSAYSRVGHWQQLTVTGLPRLVDRQMRLMRFEVGPQVDSRQAYVDGVVLNAYGGRGRTELCIDELELSGMVRSPAADPAAEIRPVGFNQADPAAIATGPAPRVRFYGDALMVNDRPLFPRAIEYQGEPLSYLAELGFNVVWLYRPPDAAILMEARRLGLWLVTPPPLARPEPDAPQAARSSESIGREFDSVLAWDLGHGLSAAQLDTTKLWAAMIREADQQVGRPLVCGPIADLRNYSRHVNVMMFDRSPIGTSLELNDYGTWLRERPRLARSGRPVWTTLQTVFPPALYEQWLAMSGGRAPRGEVTAEQLRLVVQTALSAGVRGICFQSRSRLDAQDPATRQRAAALRRLNLDLQVAEPFTASGTFAGTISGSTPEVSSAILNTDRASLLLPVWSGRGPQFVPGQAAGNGVSFIVPKTPDATDAFELSPAGMRTLVHKRVTGGVRATLDEFGLTSFVLLTQDPLVIHELRTRLAQVQRPAVQIQRQIAAYRLQQVYETNSRLAQIGVNLPEAARWLESAQNELRLADESLARSAWESAYQSTERAMRPLRLLERAHWERAVGKGASPVSNPFAVTFQTLPDYIQLSRAVAAMQAQPNVLAGGDFEDLSYTIRAGWQHYRYPDSPNGPVASDAELVDANTHSGRGCLKLKVAPSDPQSPPGLVESAPIWITSAAVPVRAGQLFRIRGWVNVPATITGSVDGLMVFDSFGGESLALRFGETEGWREFTLLRAAPRSGILTLTFALTGLGEAFIDDVTIEPLLPASTRPVAQRLPPVGNVLAAPRR